MFIAGTPRVVPDEIAIPVMPVVASPVEIAPVFTVHDEPEEEEPDTDGDDSVASPSDT